MRATFEATTETIGEKVRQLRSDKHFSIRARALDYATALGWLSVGLGVAEALAPRAVARVAGLRERPLLLPLFGLRELATGIGILSQPGRAGWLWCRVGGDALDLAALGYELATSRRRLASLATAAAAVAAITALDLKVATELS